MATSWRVYGKDTVASRLDKSELPGFFRNRIVVGPGEAAIVVSGGEIKQTITETSAKVASNWDRVKSFFHAGQDLEVLFLDLSPIDISVFLGTREASDDVRNADFQPSGGGFRTTEDRETAELTIEAISRDKEKIQAECRLRLSINFNDAHRISHLLKGREALASWDLSALTRRDLVGPVLVPLISRYDASSLRSSEEVRSELAKAVKDEVGPRLAVYGLTLDSLSITWGLTAGEKQEIALRRDAREDEIQVFAHKRILAEMGRSQDLDKVRIENLHELKLADSRGDEQLRDLLLTGELNRDNLVEGQRVNVAQIDSRLREIELDVERKESTLRIQTRREEELLRLDVEDREYKQRNSARLAQLDLEDKEMASMVRMQIQMASASHEREMAARRMEIEAQMRKQQADADLRLNEAKNRLEEDRNRMGMMERLVMMGLSKDAGDSSVLKEFIKEQTKMSVMTASDEKAKALFAAESQRNNLETFKDAENRERAHQNTTTGLASQMMESAKQTPGATVVVGSQPTAAPAAPTMVNIQTPSSPSVRESAPTAAGCPSCGQSVKKEWKACPYCGAELSAQSGRCPHCQGEVQPGWKMCPNCAKPLA